jgi:hypothetical protein
MIFIGYLSKLLDRHGTILPVGGFANSHSTRAAFTIAEPAAIKLVHVRRRAFPNCRRGDRLNLNRSTLNSERCRRLFDRINRMNEIGIL